MRQRLHPGLAFYGGTGVLLILLLSLLVADRVGWWSRSPLVVHCAAALRGPAEEAASAFERETGQAVELRFGASQSLLATIELTRQGDLLLPADDSYLQLAKEKSLLDDGIPIARMHAVVVVRAGNPKRIRLFADLLSPGVRVAQADPDVAAIGAVTRRHLRSSGQWEPLHANTRSYHGTVTDVLNAVALGSADAGIVWDALPRRRSDVEGIELPELSAARAAVSIAPLRSSRRPELARQFADYLAGPVGNRIFQLFGFDPAAP